MPNKTLARITALDAAIEWYTREKYKTLDSSRWSDLQGKMDEHREELAKLLRSIGIDENRPQDEAWGWAIRYNEQIRKKWQNCDQAAPLAKQQAMEEIDELNEKRRLKLEKISKEDCQVTLLGWVNPKNRKLIPKEAISVVEPSSQKQTTEDASSQQDAQPCSSIVDTDVAMTEAPDISPQASGNNASEQTTMVTVEDVTAGEHNDAMDVDEDLFGDDSDFCDEYPALAAPIEANNAGDLPLSPVPASSQNPNNEQAGEVPKPSLHSAEAMVAAEPQAIPVDSNTAPVQAGALSTVPVSTLETNDNQIDRTLGGVPTFFNDGFVAIQGPQVAGVVDTRIPILNETEEALFEELIDVSLLEQDVQQNDAPAQQELMLAPVENTINQVASVPQGIPVTANQVDQVVNPPTEVASSNGDFKSSAEWNEHPDIPTLEEFLQFMDEPTQQTIRTIGWAKIQKFVQPDKIHYAQLDVFAFAPPEVQETMLAEYEECYRSGGQFTLPLLQSHWNDPEFSGRTPICVNLSNFVVQMYPITDTPPDEIAIEQVQPEAHPVLQSTPECSGSFDLDTFDFGSFDFSGPIELEEIVNDFADVNGDQFPSSIEDVHQTVENSMILDATGHPPQHQNLLQSPAPLIPNKPAQAKKDAAAKKAAQGKKSAPTKRKTATPKKKGTELPLQAPVDESTFGQFVQGNVFENPITPVQEVGDGLDDWASAWCQRSWSEEDPGPKNRTPAELARLQQLGMTFNQGMSAAYQNPSPNASLNLVGAINGHLSHFAPNDTNVNSSIGASISGEQQTSATPAKRSHRGRPAAPPETLRRNRTRKLKHPESPQKVPSGKYTRRKSKLSVSSNSESSGSPQQLENASGQPTVYYEAAPNRRLGLDTSPEDWVAQSTNKRKRAKPAKETSRKARKTQQPTALPSQSSQAADTSVLSGDGRFRAILPRPAPPQEFTNGMQAPALAAESLEHSYGSINVPEPMTFGHSFPVQQAAEPYMGMATNVPPQVSQQWLQQLPPGTMMPQQNFLHGMSLGIGMSFNGGMQGLAAGMQSTFEQPMQQPTQQTGLQGMQKAGPDDMVDSDDESDDEIMRQLRKTESKLKRQEGRLRRIADLQAKIRQNEMVLAGGAFNGRMMIGGGGGGVDLVDLTQLTTSGHQTDRYQN